MVIALPIAFAFLTLTLLLRKILNVCSNRLKPLECVSFALLHNFLSYSALEVLLIATIAGFYEMPLMTKFVVDDQFPLLCEEIRHLDPKLPCVELDKAYGDGLFWLVLAVVLKALLITYIYYLRN